MRLLVALVLIVAVPSWGTAQNVTEARPFGLREGTPVAELRKLVGFKSTGADRPYVFMLTRPPEPHRAFEYYLLIATPNDGLCKVLATGVDITTSGNGQQLRDAYTRMAEALTAKYGAPSAEVDQAQEGSMWAEPQYFMMGLKAKERTLASVWESNTTAQPLPMNLSSIALDITATNTTKGYISLGYEFKNFAACKARLNKADSDPL